MNDIQRKCHILTLLSEVYYLQSRNVRTMFVIEDLNDHSICLQSKSKNRSRR